MTLWFVTPAWQRFDLSAVCFDQRLDVIRQLAEHGIEARCVVVADDENVDLARARGFDVVIRANDSLSDRFNDGMAFAGKAGAEWIVPIGADSWIDPRYFLGLRPGMVRTSRLYCHVTADRLGEAKVSNRAGVGPYVFPRRLLSRVGFRPAASGLMRGVDSATIRGIERHAGLIRWAVGDLHAFQYIGFRVPPYITEYGTLMTRWGVREHDDPWRILAQHYPVELVERVRALMVSAVAA